MATNRIKDRKGFTLVELMVVVAIIGILAAIAIPNFMNFRMKSKLVEAKANLGGIRRTELAYFAEANHFVANQPMTPILDRAHVTTKEPWNANTRFSIIGFAPEGSVYFSYELAGVDYPIFIYSFSMTAEADLDDDGGKGWYRLTGDVNEIIKGGAAF